MKKVSKISDASDYEYSSRDEQNIDHQISDFPRAYVGFQNDPSHSLNLSIFERACHDFSELISLFQLNLKSILNLRLVSKKLWNSSNKDFQLYATTLFKYSQLYLFSFPSTKEKLDFANKNIKSITVSVTVNDLINYSLGCEIDYNKLEIKVEIKNIKDLKIFSNVLLCRLKDELEFFYKIKEINLEEIEINDDSKSEVITALMIISQMPDVFLNLKTLILGRIVFKYDNNFELSQPIITLTKLVIGDAKFQMGGSFNLIAPLDNLKTLIIGDIVFEGWDHGNIRLTSLLKNLKNLSIGNIHYANTSFAQSLDNLRTFKVGEIKIKFDKFRKEKTKFELPKSLKNIRTVCLNLSYFSDFEFPELPHLNSVTFLTKIKISEPSFLECLTESIYKKAKKREANFLLNLIWDLDKGNRLCENLFLNNEILYTANFFANFALANLKLNYDEIALEYYKQAYSIYLKLFGEGCEAILEIQDVIKKLQPNFFIEQGLRPLLQEQDCCGGTRIGFECRLPIFSKCYDFYDMKYKRSTKQWLLNSIIPDVEEFGWSKPIMFGREYGIHLRMSEMNEEILYKFQVMNLGIMKSEKKPYEVAVSFTKKYPELVKKIARKHPEFFVDGSIVEACVRAMPDKASKEYILNHVSYMGKEERRELGYIDI